MKILLFMLISGACNLHAEDLTQKVRDRMDYIREHNDRSHFSISAASKDQPVNDRRTKIHFIVTDSQGRKTGFESFFITKRGSLRVNSYREIPNSSYGVDQTGSIEPEVVPDEPESASLNFFPPILKDTYTITLIGFGDVSYFADMHLTDASGETHAVLNEGYISSGTTGRYLIHLDPTPGVPAPVITKAVTFDVLRNDVTVARQLNQLGDEKFARSLIKNIDLAEKLAGVCDKRRRGKDKPCQPAIAVLKLLIKRLELANRKCDNPADCDEEREWTAFRKEHGKDDDFKDFFREWDRDDWHKHKKKCRRFVTDEALKIIRDDAGWLIKSLGEKTGDEHGKPGHGWHGGGKGGKD
jgi:hypothetical protein